MVCLGIDRAAAGAPRNTEHAEQDQDEADLFRSRERLVQHDRRKKRDRQRHDAGKERSRMRGRRKHQARVRKQHGRTAAEHDRRQSDPAEAIERKTLAHDVRQQQQPATPKRSAAISHGVRLLCRPRRATTIHPDQMLTAASP